MFGLAELFVDIAMMQENYLSLFIKGKVTKKAICEVCVHFRDKYGFSDLQTLQLARSELSIAEILRIIKEGKYNVQYIRD